MNTVKEGVLREAYASLHTTEVHEKKLYIYGTKIHGLANTRA